MVVEVNGEVDTIQYAQYLKGGLHQFRTTYCLSDTVLKIQLYNPSKDTVYIGQLKYTKQKFSNELIPKQRFVELLYNLVNQYHIIHQKLPQLHQIDFKDNKEMIQFYGYSQREFEASRTYYFEKYSSESLWKMMKSFKKEYAFPSVVFKKEVDMGPFALAVYSDKMFYYDQDVMELYIEDSSEHSTYQISFFKLDTVAHLKPMNINYIIAFKYTQLSFKHWENGWYLLEVSNPKGQKFSFPFCYQS